MADHWIPMRLDLHDDPAVIAIAGALGMDEYAVVGRLHRLWSWANRHLTSGDASCVTVVWIDRYIGAPGFAAAMQAAGWLVAGEGGVTFPSFEKWNSQGAKRRALTANRMRRARNGCDADRDAHRDAPSVTKSAPDKRERKKKEKKNPPSPPQAGGTAAPGTAVAAVVGSPAKPPRPRNHLFDAVAEVTGADPSVSGSHIAKLAHALAKAEPAYTPDEVREFGRRFHEFCPWAADAGRSRPTINEIEKYIGLLRAGPADVLARSPPPRRGFETQDDRLADLIVDTIGSTQ